MCGKCFQSKLRTTVINLEQPVHTEHTIDSCRNIGGNNSDLSQGDLQFIKTFKTARPTSSLREIFRSDGLNEFGDIFPNGTSISMVLRAFEQQLILLSGLKY